MAPSVTDRPEMAEYGVPEDLDGVLPWDWALERLEGSRCYWVATADGEGTPHAMPVWGVWLADADCFWFSCAPSARKARNLAENPKIAVTTDDATAFVSLQGTAAPSGSGPVLDEAGPVFWAKYGAEMGDMTEEDMHGFLHDNAGFTVTPARAFGMIETPEDFGPRATRWRW